MPRKAPTPDKSQSQREKFKTLAKELEADESEEVFDDALRKIGRSMPQKPSK